MFNLIVPIHLIVGDRDKNCRNYSTEDVALWTQHFSKRSQTCINPNGVLDIF
jgi:surfactin synthase thioesterase subunit